MPPPILSSRKIVKKSASWRKIFQKKCKIWNPKNTTYGKFRGKLEITGTRNLLCRKFEAVCPKITTSCPCLLFQTHDGEGGGGCRGDLRMQSARWSSCLQEIMRGGWRMSWLKAATCSAASRVCSSSSSSMYTGLPILWHFGLLFRSKVSQTFIVV